MGVNVLSGFRVVILFEFLKRKGFEFFFFRRIYYM